MRPLPCALALVAVVLAGCTSAPSPGPADGSTPNLSPMSVGTARALILGAGCNAAGGLGQNPVSPGATSRDYGIPEPFEFEDTWTYFGVPTLPVASLGNLHLALACEEWAVQGHHGHLGNVGIVCLLVKAPPFARPAPAEHNCLVSTLATLDANLAGALTAAGARVLPGQAHLWGGVAGGDPMLQIFQTGSEAWDVTATIETAGDGIYESHELLRLSGPGWPLLRMWLIVQGADGELHPAAFDLAMDNGDYLEGQGLFSHSVTSKHAGDRADRWMGGIGLRDFGLNATLDILPDVVHGMWDH